MSNILVNRYFKGANWLLIIYLSVMVSGCTPRPDALTPEAARILQTRDFNGSPEEVARALTLVLQEMHYTLGNVDMNLGLITATRISEQALAPISREGMGDSEIPDEVQTFCLIAGAAAIVGIILAIIFNDDDDDDDDNDSDSRHGDNRHRGRSRSIFHSPSPTYYGSDNSGRDLYKYDMTITLEELSMGQTRVRITVQGKHLEGSSTAESGPVQDQQFYVEFFNNLQATLNR